MSRRKTILLVDDDKDDREIFGEALHAIDDSIDFEEAFDGIDAIQKLSSATFRKPDLIFLDLNMPRMNGVQVLQELRQMEECSNVPVVIYSTSSRSEESKQLAELGAREYMIKHESFQALYAELSQAVNTYLKHL